MGSRRLAFGGGQDRLGEGEVWGAGLLVGPLPEVGVLGPRARAASSRVRSRVARMARSEAFRIWGEVDTPVEKLARFRGCQEVMQSRRSGEWYWVYDPPLPEPDGARRSGEIHPAAVSHCHNRPIQG